MQEKVNQSKWDKTKTKSGKKRNIYKLNEN